MKATQFHRLALIVLILVSISCSLEEQVMQDKERSITLEDKKEILDAMTKLERLIDLGAEMTYIQKASAPETQGI